MRSGGRDAGVVFCVRTRHGHCVVKYLVSSIWGLSGFITRQTLRLGRSAPPLMPDRSLPDARCFPYAQSALANSTDNPTAPRGDDPTANEMTLSLRLGGRDGPRRNGAPQADPKAAEAAEAARSFGHFPEEGEQLDARPGHLLVVCGDWLTHEDGSGGGGDMTTGDWKADSLPQLVCEGLTSALEAVSGRCVVVCTGGAGLSHAMVSRFVGNVGLDLCGPGRRRAPAVYIMRVNHACVPCVCHACAMHVCLHTMAVLTRVERMMKERSGEWGSLWDSALMCNRLA